MGKSNSQKVMIGRSTLWIIVALLLAVELFALSILFSQILGYSDSRSHTMIDLTQGGPNSILTVTDKNGAPITGLRPYEKQIRLSSKGLGLPAYNDVIEDPRGEKTGFGVHDEEKVWSTVTDVEIFHLSYDDNGDGHVTTASGNTDKVFAPGTGETYPFTLTNKGPYNLKYRLTVEAYYEGTDGLWIPIQARFLDSSNAYIVGSAEEWPDVLELNKVDLTRYLAPSSQADYSLQWRWVFERGEQIQEGLYQGDYTEDFYDTMLGNRAVGQDMILHVIIRTWTEIDETAPGPGPDTGDHGNMILWGVVALAALLLLILLLFLIFKSRRRERDEG